MCNVRKTTDKVAVLFAQLGVKPVYVVCCLDCFADLILGRNTRNQACCCFATFAEVPVFDAIERRDQRCSENPGESALYR